MQRKHGWNGWNRNVPKRDEGKLRRKRGRIWILQGILVLSLSAVVWRVYDVQKVYGQKLETDAARSIDVTRPVLAPRGSILDAQGSQLAYDIPAFHFDIKTSDIQAYVSQIAAEIAPIMGTSTSYMTTYLTGSDKWKQWPHTVTQPQKSKLQAVFAKHAWVKKDSKTGWKNDITFTPTEQRFYPFNEFAANTIGYMSTTGLAVGGIEREYNKYLRGQNGQMTYQQDALGYPMPGTTQVTKTAAPGDNVQLTIDETIQGYVENEMNSLIKKYSPQHAAIIVMNPQTGAVLAMSSRPTFNPNQYWKATSAGLNQNWAVSSSFEPGSTFKPIVLSAALATNSIKLNDTFKSGQITVDGQTIHDWKYGGWGTLTYQEALEVSSNVGFTKIALATGWPNMNHYLQLFGITQKTGIDLPDEAGSILFSKAYQHQIQLATSGFGQGISVTPLQQMMAIGAIANGGNLMKPYVASKIIGPNGNVVKQFHPTVVRKNIIPKSVANVVSHTMVLDVVGKDGIDTAARIPGYEVAGKTGTAQIVNSATGKYYASRFETSFIGYAPAQNPKVEVYVTLYWPKTQVGNQWGSSTAAPTAARIIKDCLEYYHIPPTGAVNSAAQDTPSKSNQASYVKTPNIVGMTQKQAKAKLTSLGIRAMFAGQSGEISRQWPAAGIEVTKGSSMYGLLQTSPGSEVTVPNLTGLSLRDATNLLAAMSLGIHPTGNGFVQSQTIPAGTKVSPGTVITTTLQPTS